MTDKQAKGRGTFVIKILDQRNSTWQGSITWVEEQRVQNFRSALELLRMIDGVLAETNEAAEGTTGA